MVKTVKVWVQACSLCGTPAYETWAPTRLAGLGWHECTSGHGLAGGGACCAPLGHVALPPAAAVTTAEGEG